MFSSVLLSVLDLLVTANSPQNSTHPIASLLYIMCVAKYVTEKHIFAVVEGLLTVPETAE